MTGLQPNVFAAVSITWAAALTALVLRVVARRMTKMAWWIDDYFCVSAFVFASGYNTILLICRHQFLRHLQRILQVLTATQGPSTGGLANSSTRPSANRSETTCSCIQDSSCTVANFAMPSRSRRQSSQYWASTGAFSNYPPFESPFR